MTYLLNYILAEDVAETRCRSYKCDTLTRPVCASENVLEDGNYNYTLQDCADRTKQYCPWSNLVPGSNTTISCLDNPAENKQKRYPGQACATGDDCFSTQCNNQLCVGVAENAACNTHSDCLMGLFCKQGAENKTCSKQVADTETCTEDEDCMNTSGCNDAKCTPYFSLADGTTVTAPNNNKWSLCSSGEAGDDNKCRVRTNKVDANTACTADCVYVNADATETTVAGSCKCAYNAGGMKYCSLANGDNRFKAWVTNQKDLLTANMTEGCHTVERTSCVATANSNAVTVQKTVNSKIEVDSFPELMGVETCVRDIAFPLWKSQVNPPEKKCPTYTCGDLTTAGQCAMMKGNEYGKNSTLKVCANANETCIFNEALVNANENLNVSCTTRPDAPKRFPGEACDNNDMCRNANCTSSKCAGAAKEATCGTDENCVAGLYCNGTMCVDQIALAGECTRSMECVNSAGCYNKKCTNYYSLAAGVDVSTTMAAAGEGHTFCKFGLADVNNKCNEPKYGEGMTVESASGLVKCNFAQDQKCNYTNTDNTTYTEDCGCAYNADGDSFCKESAQENSAKFGDYYTSLRDTYANNCHTLSRFSCYDTPVAKLTTRNTNLWNTVMKHKFYNSGECVKSIMGSSNFLVFSFFGLLAMFAFML